MAPEQPQAIEETTNVIKINATFWVGDAHAIAIQPSGGDAHLRLQPQGDVVREIAIELIDRNPYQTRTRFDEIAMAELAESIKSSGVIQPIMVRPQQNGRFQLIAGERRWMASQKAGKKTIPAIAKNVSNEQAMEITIIENLQREDLNAMEQARAYERLGREFGLTQEQMAQRTGRIGRRSRTSFDF